MSEFYDLDVVDAGFNTQAWEHSAAKIEFEMLTIAWKELIRERLEAPVPA